MREPIVKTTTAVKPPLPTEELLDAALWLSEHYGFPSPSLAAHEARRRERVDPAATR